MKILDILAEDMVAPALRGRTKQEVLEELAALVASHHPEIDKSKLYEILEKREKLGSTAIGEGIAIPHGKLGGLDRVVGAFGRSREGIDFQSLDGQPSYLFFLLVAPQDSTGVHLKALARVSRLLKSPAFRERLLAANTREEIYQAIREEDDKY